MKPLAAALLIALGSAGPVIGHPEGWLELTAEDGRVAQVAIEFSLEEIARGPDGMTTLRAFTAEGAVREGFALKLGRARPEKLAVQGRRKPLDVMRLNVEVHSLGPATRELERRLNALLQTSDPLVLTGPYRGTCQELAASVSHPMLVSVSDAGIAWDDDGKPVEGGCFGLTLFLDLPLRRATIYVHEPPGYGGSARFYAVRRKWDESLPAPGSEGRSK